MHLFSGRITMQAHPHNNVFLVSFNKEAVNILFLGKLFVQKIFIKVNRIPFMIAFDYPFCSLLSILSYTVVVGLVSWEVSFHVNGMERCPGFPLFCRILWKFHFWVTCEISQLDGLPSLRSRAIFVHAKIGIFFSAIIDLKIWRDETY